MPHLFVTDRLGAEWALKKFPFAALVSCHDPASTPCEGFDNFVGPKVSFSFADTEPSDPSLGMFSATSDDVKKLIKFAEDTSCLDGRVLVHCNAGVSRSSASAFVLQCFWDGDNSNEGKSWKTTLSSCVQKVMPNEHVVMLADNFLNRDGRMIWEVQTFNDSVRWSRMYN